MEKLLFVSRIKVFPFFFFFLAKSREIAWFSSKIRNYAKTKFFFPPGRKRSLRFAQASLSGEAKGQFAR